MPIPRRLLLMALTLLLFLSLAGATAAQPPLDQPGISVPRCDGSAIALYWHTHTYGTAAAPYGWRVQRRHLGSDDFVVWIRDFLGSAATNLQTYSSKYWDWTDNTASPGIDYTYRVRALDENGNEMADRRWSRRAPASC